MDQVRWMTGFAERRLWGQSRTAHLATLDTGIGNKKAVPVRRGD
jgi:hypothetical protein